MFVRMIDKGSTLRPNNSSMSLQSNAANMSGASAQSDSMKRNSVLATSASASNFNQLNDYKNNTLRHRFTLVDIFVQLYSASNNY